MDPAEPPPHATRLRVVGVMGSGREEHAELAEPLGVLVARLGAHLLTGGGRGAMAAVARGFLSVRERRGLSLGVLPALSRSLPARVKEGYPNPWVELAVRTHLPHSGERGREPLSRNHVNVLTADCVVALPGGAGTRSEVELALAYGRPLLAWLPDGADLEGGGLPQGVPRARELAEVEAFLRERLAPDPAP